MSREHQTVSTTQYTIYYFNVGFEEEVLRGAVNTKCVSRPIIFLELHGHLISQRGMMPETVLQQLTEAGYTRWQNLEGRALSFKEIADAEFNARFVAMCG